MEQQARKTKVFEVLECGSMHGVGMQVAALCDHLDGARFEVWVVYAVRPGCSAAEFERLTAKAARHVHVPEMVRAIRPASDLAALWKLRRLMLRERPDVVHAHSSKAGVLARVAAWLAGVPRVYYTPHGYGFLQTNVSAAARILYWCIELLVSWIGHIVSTSGGEAQLSRRLAWGKTVFVVPNLFSLEAEPPPVRREPYEGVVVGALGRLTPARRPEAFLRLARRLADEHPSVRFLWIGGGELEAAVRQEVSRLELDSRFEMTGHVGREELLRRLARMDVFVHFSLWEGSPVSVMEAMHFRKPVVASRIRGNADLVLDGVTGYLVEDEDELFRMTAKLIDSPPLRLEMGERGHQRIKEEFSLERSARAIESLYLTGKLP